MNTLHKALLSTALAILVAAPLAAQQQARGPRPRVSPHETISAVIGGNRVTITYGRPYSKDPGTGAIRKIFGTGTPQEFVVPYGAAWRMGADEATLLLIQQPIVMGEVTVPAGAYTLYLVPMETGPSKLAISTNIGKWGIPVDEAHDLARVDAKKEATANTVDQFTMSIERDPSGGGVIKMMWENTQFSVPFTNKK